MEKDVLSQVIEAEKEIQRCLEQEKAKAREWLERVNRETEEGFRIEQSKIKESLDRSLSEAAKQAEAQAGAVVKQTAEAAERLRQLKKEILIGIVNRRISRILPG